MKLPTGPAQAAPSNTRVQKLAATIGNSAEYAVAIALLAVVGVVCGAIGLFTLQDQPGKNAVTPAVAETAPVTSRLQQEEQAALAEWQKKLKSETEVPVKRPEKIVAPEPARAPATAPIPAPAVVPAPAAAEPAKAPPPPVAALSPPVARGPVRVGAVLDRSSCRPPKYPDSAAQAQQEGLVVMGFQIDTTGQIIDRRIEQSSGTPLLDKAALNALGRCKFSPAMLDGVAQTAWTQVRFKWQLDQ